MDGTDLRTVVLRPEFFVVLLLKIIGSLAFWKLLELLFQEFLDYKIASLR
jgi:hypothetical protein